MTRIAVSGDQGSFSEEAGEMYIKKSGNDSSLVYATDMEGSLQKVESGEAELGIFPVVNSRGGLVQTAFEAMGRHLFELVDQIELEVHQCLIALPGVAKSDITLIASHPQALSQCRQYLDKEFPNIERKEWRDTAKAVKDLKEGVLPRNTGVIASARSAALYSLEVIEKDIEDVRPNITTFIVVKKPS